MDAVLVDVRSAEEWQNGHISGALHLPIEQIAVGQTPDLPKNTKIYLYCRTGSRASLAEHVLKTHGFTDVINLGSLQSASQYGPIVKGR